MNDDQLYPGLQAEGDTGIKPLPRRGTRPEIYGTQPTSPFTLLRDLVEQTIGRKLWPVQGGPAFDALSQLLQQHPGANRAARIDLKQLPPGQIGGIEGRGFAIDPSQMGDMLTGTPTDQFREVMAHETAHLMGHDEPEAREIAPQQQFIRPDQRGPYNQLLQEYRKTKDWAKK